MKPFRSFLIFLLAVISPSVIAEEKDEKHGATKPSPAELIASRCMVCHANPGEGAQRLAPPFAMVKRHYDDLDEAAFIKAVSKWVPKPDEKKSRMPGAVRNFGLMPPLPLPKEEISAIARYLHATDFPMPGHGGMGHGKGRGRNAKSPADKESCGCGKSCDGGCGE
ncbi:cytochrome c [Haloferula helveola]|uniref:Cytochrome c n=1 Tax=Haloferula helveola TaxID=490095 RepID=A0ABM7RDN3_9BACT|nr:cytochrome c [Haloferula helveola]